MRQYDGLAANIRRSTFAPRSRLESHRRDDGISAGSIVRTQSSAVQPVARDLEEGRHEVLHDGVYLDILSDRINRGDMRNQPTNTRCQS